MPARSVALNIQRVCPLARGLPIAVTGLRCLNYATENYALALINPPELSQATLKHCAARVVFGKIILSVKPTNEFHSL